MSLATAIVVVADAVTCAELRVYVGVTVFLPIGVELDIRVGNELIVVAETVKSGVAEARVITLAPNTFQFNSQLLFSLTVLGLAVRLNTAGGRDE
jgi:hypothetical protein